VGRGESTVGVQAAAEVVSRPGSTPVRVWPHHFDIASLLVLDSGDRSGAACLTLDASDVRGLGSGDSSGSPSNPRGSCSGTPLLQQTPVVVGLLKRHGLSRTARNVRMTM
jgi:hypothetical protein